MPPLTFLVSSGRAGTTLLRAMMDSHPRMAVTPETYFVTRLASRHDGTGDRAFEVDRLLEELLANKWFVRWGLEPEMVRRRLREQGPASYSDAITEIYRLFAESRGKELCADKTPIYVYDVALLASLFPDARFIHLIRDGRSVACSFIAQRNMRPNGVGEAALLWRERVTAGRSAGADLDAGRYLEVRYESLVGDTEPTLREICEFVGVGYDDAMLTYAARAAELVEIDGGPERHRAVFLPPTPGLRDWNAELSRAQVELFELIAGDLLQELGYRRVSISDGAAEHHVVAELIAELDRLRLDVEAVQRRMRRRVQRIRGSSA